MSEFNSDWMWIITILSIIGTVLNIKKKRVCFAIWIVTDMIWCVYDWHIWEYQQSALFFVSLCLAIWGFVVWGR